MFNNLFVTNGVVEKGTFYSRKITKYDYLFQFILQNGI